MRTGARAFIPATLLLSLMAGLLVPDAAAGSITTFYGGTVTGALAGHNYPANVATGNTINGNNSFFSYDPAQTVLNNVNGLYTFTGTHQGLALFVNTVPSGPFGTSWSDSYSTGGSYQIQMVVSGTTTTMEVLVATGGGSAAGKTGAGVELDFTSTTYTGGGTAGRKALPTATNIGAFLTTTARLTWDPGDLGFKGVITNINGQSVPEPSSLVLAVVAMATSAGFLIIFRRKAAGRFSAGSIAPSSHP